MPRQHDAYWTEGIWILDLLEKEKGAYIYVPSEKDESSIEHIVIETKGPKMYSRGYNSYNNYGTGSKEFRAFRGRVFLITEEESSVLENAAEQLRGLGKASVDLNGRDTGENFSEMGHLLELCTMVRNQRHVRAKEIMNQMAVDVQLMIPTRIASFLKTNGGEDDC